VDLADGQNYTEPCPKREASQEVVSKGTEGAQQLSSNGQRRLPPFVLIPVAGLRSFLSRLR